MNTPRSLSDVKANKIESFEIISSRVINNIIAFERGV